MPLEQYFTLGRTGLKVSRLALGAMTFGTGWGWGANKDTARTLFDAYIDAGGNFVDTADAYTGGDSESFVGEFTRGKRDRVVVSTKVSYSLDPSNPNAGGNGRKHILSAVEGSLKRLNTDYIDLYILHTWDHVTPVEEVVRTFDDLVRSGKVRYVGLSDVPAWYASRGQAIAELRGFEAFSALQLEYSLAERAIEDEYVPLGIAHGMGVMVWSPLASGLFSGKYRPSTASLDDAKEHGNGRLKQMSGSSNPAFDKLTPANWKIVAELERAADAIGRSMAQVALNWVSNRPGVASVLIGATKLDQLQDNLGALDFDIPQELLDRLDGVSKPEPRFPYYFFEPDMQAMLAGEKPFGDKPPHYAPPLLMAGKAAGTS
jgi:aryl-alcohol dehydrogenase-like predicted oxidoreductase